MSRQAGLQVSLVSTCSPDTYLLRKSLSNFSLSCFLSLSVISPLSHPTISPFSSPNVSASFKHVRLHSQPSSLFSHYRLLSLGQAELKGESECVSSGPCIAAPAVTHCHQSGQETTLEAWFNQIVILSTFQWQGHLSSVALGQAAQGAGGARTNTRMLLFPLICQYIP